MGVSAVKYKFGARAGKHKLGARAGKHKLGARARAGGKQRAEGREIQIPNFKRVLGIAHRYYGVIF